jgi:hypothetical protein
MQNKIKMKNEWQKNEDNNFLNSQRQCNGLTFNKLLCECARFHNELS